MKYVFRGVLVVVVCVTTLIGLSVHAETYGTMTTNAPKNIRTIPKMGVSEFVVPIGKTVNLGEVDWLKMTLLGLPGNHPGETCDDENECLLFNSTAKILILAEEADGAVRSKQEGILKKGEPYYFGEGELIVEFIESSSDGWGKFIVTIQDDQNPLMPNRTPQPTENPQTQLIQEDNSPGIKIAEPFIGIENNEVEKIPDYQIIKAPMVGTKDVISISTDEISIKEENGEAILVAPMTGIVQVVSVEIGPDKAEEDADEPRSEVLISKTNNIVAINIVRGATKEDCEEYRKECDANKDQMICQKWNDVCKVPDYSPNRCSKLLSLCNEENEGACKKYSLTCKVVSSAITQEKLEIKENKIFVNNKEIKIMPDTASAKAIEALQLKKEVEIELKDTGKPTYEIMGEKEVKIFGFIKAKMNVQTEINAETGEIENTKKPWWKFLAW